MKRPTPAGVSDADRRLFRTAIGKVRRFAPVLPAATAMRPVSLPCPPRANTSVQRAPLDMTFDPTWLVAGEALAYLRPGQSPKLLRQLQRGKCSVQDDLDLHRMHAGAAQASVARFLAAAQQHGLRCVRIVHGKGLRSGAAGPVLKGLVDRMLRQWDDVIAFASARPALGGTGAVVVLLRGSTKIAAARRRGSP